MLSPFLSLLPSLPVFRLDISRHRKDLDTLDDPSGQQGNSRSPCGPLPWALPGALGGGGGRKWLRVRVPGKDVRLLLSNVLSDGKEASMPCLASCLDLSCKSFLSSLSPT